MKLYSYYRNADNTYTEKYENKWGIKPQSAICHGERKPVMQDVEVDFEDPETGEIGSATQPQEVPIRLCVWIEGDDAPRKATQGELDAQAKVKAQSDAIAKETSDNNNADYEQWSAHEKIMLKLIVKEINILRGMAGLPARTNVQVKAALKAEL